MRLWMARNPERTKQHARNSYHRHREKRLAYERGRLTNPEFAASNNERAKQWQREHREHRKEYLRQYHLRRKAEAVARAAAWKKAHPERAKTNAVHYSHKRRTRLAGTDPKLSAQCKPIIARERAKRWHRCYWCKKRFAGRFHVDHIVAVANGGRHEPANLAISCPDCNVSKSDKPVEKLLSNGQRFLAV